MIVVNMDLVYCFVVFGVVILATTRCTLADNSLNFHVDKSGCPKTKGCYSFPEHCSSSSDCDYLVTYVPSKDYVTFSASAKGEYVAFGVNDKSAMSGTDSIICFKSSNGIQVGHFQLIGHDAPKYDPSNKLPVGINVIAKSYADGVIKCKFQRSKIPTKNMAYDLNRKLYMIFARGTVNDKFVNEHKWSDKSWKMVNVSIPLEIEGEEFDLLLAHAGLMFLAWIGFATVGIFTSRYKKSAWGDKKLFNGHIWFRIHQACVLTTVLLVVTALIVIFVHVGGWSEGAHPFIGIIAIVFMLVQPIMAFFRPEPQSYQRFMFTWAHRFVGLGVFLLAIINCFLGVNMVDELKEKGSAILSVFLVLLVLSVVLYELFLFNDKKPVLEPFSVDSDGDHVEIRTPADQTVNEEPTTPQTNEEKRGEKVRSIAYVFIITLSFVCCLAFVIVLATVY